MTARDIVVGREYDYDMRKIEQEAIDRKGARDTLRKEREKEKNHIFWTSLSTLGSF